MFKKDNADCIYVLCVTISLIYLSDTILATIILRDAVCV